MYLYFLFQNISSLPDEILTIILALSCIFSDETEKNIKMVCKKWNMIAKTHHFSVVKYNRWLDGESYVDGKTLIYLN